MEKLLKMKRMPLSLHRMALLVLVLISVTLITSCLPRPQNLKLESCSQSGEGCVGLRAKWMFDCLICPTISNKDQDKTTLLPTSRKD